MIQYRFKLDLELFGCSYTSPTTEPFGYDELFGYDCGTLYTCTCRVTEVFAARLSTGKLAAASTNTRIYVYLT